MEKNTRLPGVIILFFYLIIASASRTVNFSIPLNNFKSKTYLDTLVHPPLTLTGTVKNQQGEPLKDVRVVAGNAIVTSTDNAGVFNFSIENKPTVLTFSLDKMVTVKRSYHPAMQQTSFNITMEKDSCKYCARIMQAIRSKN